MAAGKGIRAGRAFVEAYMDDSKLAKGVKASIAKLKRMGAAVANVGQKMAMLGAAALAPLIGAAKIFSSVGDEVAKMSKRTGVSVEALSELRFVASQTGTEFATLENGFRKMQRSIYDAGRGLSTQTEALADLGLAFEDLDGKLPEEQFKILATAIGQVEDPTKKAAIAMALFGRTGTNLLPMFQGGAKGIAALQAEARKLGLTISAETAKAAEEFTDTLDRLWKVVKHGVFLLGAALAPTMDKAAKDVMKGAHAAQKWIKQNKSLIVTALKVAAAVAAIGIGLMVIGKIIVLAGTLIKVIHGVGIAIKGVQVAFALLAANPIVAVIAGVAAVAVAAALAIRHLTKETEAYTEAAQAQLDKGDQQRRQDLQRIARLERLAAKESLNSAEMKLAAQLVAELESSYGDLGIEIDAVTGKITGMTKGLAGANAEMANRARSQVEYVMSGAYSDLERARKEANDDRVFWNTNPALRILPWVGISEKKRAGWQADADVALATLAAGEKRLAELDAGQASGLTGAGPDLEGQIAVIEAETAAEAAAARQVHILKLQALEDEHARGIELINERYDHEIAKAKEAGATQTQLDSMQQARSLELIAAGKAAQLAANEEVKQAEAEAEAKAKRDADKDEAEQQAIATANSDTSSRVAELELRATYEGYDLEVALMELRRADAVAAAKAAGENAGLVEHEYDLLGQLLAQRTSAPDVARQASTTGTFSAANVQSLQAGQGLSQMAKGITNIERNTRPLRDAAPLVYSA